MTDLLRLLPPGLGPWVAAIYALVFFSGGLYYLEQRVARTRDRADRSTLDGLSTRVTDDLANRQLTEGPNAGSWEPTEHQWSQAGGRVYATAMAALSLEAHQRAERPAGRIM